MLRLSFRRLAKSVLAVSRRRPRRRLRSAGGGGAPIDLLEQRVLLTESGLPVDMPDDSVLTESAPDWEGMYEQSLGGFSLPGFDTTSDMTGSDMPFTDSAWNTDLYGDYQQQADSQSTAGEESINDVQESADTTEPSPVDTTAPADPLPTEPTDPTPADDTGDPPVPADPRYAWQAFTLPDGFTFDEAPLPAEAFLDDLLQLGPVGTDSFVSETLFTSAPMVQVTPEELGVGEKTIGMSTQITLSQSWTSPDEWTVTQTRHRTFASQEQSADDAGVRKDFTRLFTSTLSISIVNGTQASVTVSFSDVFAVGVGLDWNDDPDTEAGDGPSIKEFLERFLAGGADLDDRPSGNVNQGSFGFTANLAASFTSTWEMARITTPAGLPATAYTVGVAWGAASDLSAQGLSLFSQNEGTLVEQPPAVSDDGTPLSGPSPSSGTPLSGSPLSETPLSDSPGGNGSSLTLASGFSGTSQAGITFNASRRLVIPDDPAAPRYTSGNASYTETAADTSSGRLGLNLRIQESNEDFAEFLHYGSDGHDSSQFSFDFDVAADFQEQEFFGDEPPALAAAALTTTTDPTTDTPPPEIGLEMSLGEASRHREELHYTRRERMTPHGDIGEIGVRVIDYHVVPVSETSGNFEVAANEDGDLILTFSVSSTGGFQMNGFIGEELEFNYIPGSDYFPNELYRTQFATRYLQECRTATQTTELTLNLSDPIDWDSVEFTTTTVIDASGSDITDDHTVWHVWVLDESGSSDENATAGPTPVFIEDIPVQVDTSLTYDYTQTADGTATGTAQLVHTEYGGRYYNADGTESVGTYSVTTTTDLITGESTTQTTSTFPPYVPVPTTGGTTGGDNDGFLTGVGHGLAMVGNAATFHLIAPLDDYVDSLIEDHAGVYGWANGAAHVGAYAAEAAGVVWAWAAAGGGQFGVGITRGGSTFLRVPVPHVVFQYGTTSATTIAHGAGLGSVWVTTAGAPATMPYLSLTGVPILFPGAIGTWVATSPETSNCLTAAIQAWLRGMGL